MSSGEELVKDVNTAKRFIPVSEPNLCGNEEAYVLDCLRSTWISSKGEYIERFERSFAEYVGVEHAVASSNGTTALHLMLHAMDIGPGDEVIVPTLTYVASANVAVYVGAKPVFVDSDPETWNMKVEEVRQAITSKTRAVMAVHLYGAAVDMKPLRKICLQAGIPLIEDAAEALGTQYQGAMAGALGDAAAFSFFGNKTITTGEGGMVTTNNGSLAQRIRRLRDQGQSPNKRYWHDEMGFNYRMTNIQAAIGLAQLENIDQLVEQKRINASLYQRFLPPEQFQHPVETAGTVNSYWMYSVLLNGEVAKSRDKFMASLMERGVETRPFFYPVHSMPMFTSGVSRSFPGAESVSARGISLPSSTRLTEEDIIFVCDAVRGTSEEFWPGHE